MKKFLFAVLSFFVLESKAQNDTVIFTQLGHFYYDTTQMWSAYSPLIDRMGRPYVYTASMDLGMVEFDISNQMAPVPVCTLTVANLNGLKATYLAQSGNNLFVACGNFQSSGQRAGLSIYDVTNPLVPVLKDHWDSAAFTNGCAHIVVSGNYAYLACMTDGIVVLDISNPNNIHFAAHIIPTVINCTHQNNTRGLFLSHDTLLAVNDCGGLRIISVTNPAAPVEIGTYTNAAAYGSGQPSYNKVWRIGDHAYIPVDYCGFEIDNVANPLAVTNEAMWNPIPCNNFNWFGADEHTNEIVWTGPSTNVLMVSGGDSQVLAFDPTNPSNARLMGRWGMPNTDSLVAWGIDEYNGLVCSGYIRDVIQFLQPYYGTYGGIQLLSYSVITGMNENNFVSDGLKLYPNPSSSFVTLALPQSSDRNFSIEVTDVLGNMVLNEKAEAGVNGRNYSMDLSSLASGVYTIRVTGEHAQCSGKIIKN